MTAAADVTVIMANHNGARYLTAAIQSVVRQTLGSWELIIVDDASTDDSVAMARRAAAGDPRVTIIVQERNQGPAAARNRALEQVTARWIAIMDSDDLMLPQRLELLLRQAESSGAAIIADNLLVFSQNARPQPFLAERRSRGASWVTLDEFIRSNCLYSRCPDLGYLKPMIRADIVLESGLRYDETLRIGEDYNFLARLMARGHRLLLDPASLYLYRKHDASISHRLRSVDIAALIAAEDRFTRRAGTLRPKVAHALKRRQRTLNSLLVYDAVIAAIKCGDLASAAGRAFKRPHIWPLLMQPITARLRRGLAKRRLDGDASPGDAVPEARLHAVSDPEMSGAATS
jgi:succinoglycan biosynthesis protein ExoO